jgi:hypothetical protein
MWPHRLSWASQVVTNGPVRSWILHRSFTLTDHSSLVVEVESGGWCSLYSKRATSWHSLGHLAALALKIDGGPSVHIWCSGHSWGQRVVYSKLRQWETCFWKGGFLKVEARIVWLQTWIEGQNFAGYFLFFIYSSVILGGWMSQL